jgi:hypothetical protein
MAGQVCACALLGLWVAGCAGLKPQAGKAGKGVQIVRLEDRLGVNINGQFFTEYVFQNTPRPYCYPVLGPGGVGMTRNSPMRDVPGEDKDHKHHRSFWFAHGSVNGVDFWSEGDRSGKTLHDAFTDIRSGPEIGLIRSRNRWVAPDGRVICTDERTLRFHNGPANERLVDFEITLYASHGELTLGDTKEGTMALRLAETMRLKHNKYNTGKPTGHIVNSEGVRDGATWGKRAAWCDYYGPVDDAIVGVAIFDHPRNPRYPTWWHVRDYGLFAANPFGQHDFENLPDKAVGNLVVPAGDSVTFRYRFYFHEGDEQQARVADHYADYVKTASIVSR